jgi:ATP-dependent DNA helicase RecG
MTLQEEIQKGESKILELKETLPKGADLAKTIIAFANTSGGKLIIGVNDNREVIGLDDNEIFAIQDKISGIIYDRCYPNILPEIYTANIEDRLVLVIEIFRGNLLPYYLKKDGKNNGTYIRIGATNRKAEFENILELERHRRNISFDEEINYEIELETLDLTPIQSKFAAIGKVCDTDKLKNLKLLKEEHGKTYPTNALLILLGIFEHVIIKCSRFKGRTMDVFLDKKEYTGDLFTQLENAENFIKNHIHLKGEINGLQRTDTYEIPIVAIREALVNAVVHRDYSNRGRDIKLGIYDDIVNIVSPGGLPHAITEQNLTQGRSEIRNRALAGVLKNLNYIEQWGTGIKRIKSSCIQHGLQEPEIKETGDFVDVVLYRK